MSGQKAFRSNKAIFSAGLAVAASSLIGIAVSIWQAVRATTAKVEAVAASQTAEAVEKLEGVPDGTG